LKRRPFTFSRFGERCPIGLYLLEKLLSGGVGFAPKLVPGGREDVGARSLGGHGGDDRS